MIVRQKNAALHSPSYCILLPQRTFRDEKRRRYYLFFTMLLVTRVQFYPFTGICPALAKWSDTFQTKAYFVVVSFSNKKFALHDVLLWGRSKYQETVRKNYYPLVYTKIMDIVFRALWLATQTQDIQCFSPPSEPKLATSKWLPGLLSYLKQTKKFHKKTKKLFPTTGRRQRNSVWQFFITGKALSV